MRLELEELYWKGFVTNLQAHVNPLKCRVAAGTVYVYYLFVLEAAVASLVSFNER